MTVIQTVSGKERVITVEHAHARLVRKPWGRRDLRPWSKLVRGGEPIGEIWFERTGDHGTKPSLLLKLLFARETLSIQVHPDDAYAQTMGLPHGKTEAWYILSAEPGAKVATGLKRSVTATALRAAIDDGSIMDLVAWHEVAAGDTVLVPAGTIHAIGAGLVIAEIQQRSDVTFRLFDYGRQRELHVDQAVAVAFAGPAIAQDGRLPGGGGRMVLADSPYFVMERIDLPPDTRWDFNATTETWLLALSGGASLGTSPLSTGEVLFLEDDQIRLETGADRMSCLLAYRPARPCTHPGEDAHFPIHQEEARS